MEQDNAISWSNSPTFCGVYDMDHHALYLTGDSLPCFMNGKYPFISETGQSMLESISGRISQRVEDIIANDRNNLYLIDPYINIKHHFCLSYDECRGLIIEIQDKLEQLRKYLDSAVGKCAFCGKSIYEDISRYEFASGEMLHEMCMGLFIQRPVSANAKLPVTRVYRQKTFAHTQILNESVYAYPFPSID